MGSNSPTSSSAGQGRSRWARKTISAPAGDDESPSPKSRAPQRFVEPFRLSDAQRATILAALAHKEIGDDDSRGLFAAALEYDLASFHQRVTQPTPKPKPKRPTPEPAAEEDNALAELARTAQSLIDRLAQLDDDAKRRLAQVLRETDRFKRSYGEDYLESLRCALARLATAGKPASTPAPAPVDTPPPEPSLPEAAGVFILRAADVFQECFEQEPTAVRGAPFVAAVKAIAEATGIAIPTELGTLSRILKQG